MRATWQIAIEEARSTGMWPGLDWAPIGLQPSRQGLEGKFEHPARDPETDVTNEDLILTPKIASAHPKDVRDYHTRLDQFEAEAQASTAGRQAVARRKDRLR